jgi:GH24 family phage-related lysozyme (muramidase)
VSGSQGKEWHIVGGSDTIPTWTAEYFNNKTLSGTPVHTEGVGSSYSSNGYGELALNWGFGSPKNTPVDGFSARIKTKRYLSPGLYQIQTGADDGIRVMIDGQKVTDRWVFGSGDSGYFYSDGKEHDIQVEYYEEGGGASLDFKIKSATKINEPVNESQEWKTSIYNWNPTQGSQPPQDFFIDNSKLIGTLSLGSNIRSDGKFGINANWQDGAIKGDKRLPHDNFAIRSYTHKLLEAGKTYKVTVTGDDGFELFAKQWYTNNVVDLLSNRRQVPTGWTQNYPSQGAKTYEFTVDNTAWYDLIFQMFEVHSPSSFDFKLEEGCAGGHDSYYPELAGLSDDEWDRQSGDDNQFRTNSPFGGGDQTSKTDDRIRQIYTDLSQEVLGIGHQMNTGYAHDQGYFDYYKLWHTGIDIDASAGTNVKAVVGGNVAWISAPGTNNSFIGINSDDGRQWVYGHVGNLQVSVGNRVNIGDDIAKIGYQNHLHLEVENGHAYGNTDGAHTDQAYVKNVTLSPLQAYWELQNADSNHETCNTSSGGTGSSGLVSSKGLKFIGNFEGFSPNLYNDPAGHATIGYGHLVHRGGINGSEPVEFRNGITNDRALELLQQDASIAVQAVQDLVKVPLNQAQFDALVSFTFNLGRGNLAISDLLARLNNNEYNSVPYELSRWNKAEIGGVLQPLPGLTRRRNEEGILFQNGIYTGVA